MCFDVSNCHYNANTNHVPKYVGQIQFWSHNTKDNTRFTVGVYFCSVLFLFETSLELLNKYYYDKTCGKKTLPNLICIKLVNRGWWTLPIMYV